MQPKFTWTIVLLWGTHTPIYANRMDINRDNGKRACSYYSMLCYLELTIVAPEVLFQYDNSSVVTSIQKGSCGGPIFDASPAQLIIFHC